MEIPMTALTIQAHEAGGIVDTQLLHDFTAVDIEGFGTDAQFLGDLFPGIAFGDELQDLALPGGKLLQRTGRARLTGEIGEEVFRDGRREIRFATRHCSHRQF